MTITLVLSILIILIPVIIAVTGFLVLKSVQLGLKWQLQTTKEEQPTLEVNPIKPIIEAKKEKKAEAQQQETASVFQEWLHGE